jgi:Yip1 domain
MEELVGNHGGVGGEQTDAFIFHPKTFSIPATSNSADMFHILNLRRGLPVDTATQQKTAPVLRGRDAWTYDVLWRGLLRARLWLTIAARSMLLDRWAFRQAAFNPYMTGPALFIGLVTTLVVTLLTSGGFNLAEWMTRLGTWFIGTLFVYGAARLLGGKGDFTSTLRATGFAQTSNLLEVLVLVTPLAPLARIAAFIVTFLATWIAASEAQKLHGWRTFLLPVAALVIFIASAFVLNILWNSAAISLDSLVRAYGLLAR